LVFSIDAKFFGNFRDLKAFSFWLDKKVRFGQPKLASFKAKAIFSIKSSLVIGAIWAQGG
jgi:hypothetical protein